MKLPLEWLNELVNDLPEVDELVETLIGIGLEVDNVSTLPGAPKNVKFLLVIFQFSRDRCSGPLFGRFFVDFGSFFAAMIF